MVCSVQPRHWICYTLFYSWGFYGVLWSVVAIIAMLLHYAHVEPDVEEEKFSSSEEDSN